MAFEDLRDLLTDQTLPLPIGGVTYHVQACTAEDWLWLNTESARIDTMIRKGEADEQVEGDDPAVFFRRCLGVTFDDMVEDAVTSKELQVAALTAFFWHLGNAELAEAVWVNGGKALLGQSSLEELGKQVRQTSGNRTQRRAATRTTSRSSTKPVSTKPGSATSRAASASKKAKTPPRSTRRTA